MREIGIVTECKGERAKVAVLRRSVCGENCASCRGGCTPTKSIINAQNEIGAKRGDRVLIELADNRAFSAAALVYILPLAALFAGSAAGYFAGMGEGRCALLGLAAMALCFAALHIVSRVYARFFCVQITRILSSEENGR